MLSHLGSEHVLENWSSWELIKNTSGIDVVLDGHSHSVIENEIVKDNMLSYNYRLEENGANISGGQRQRIILARALLKNSKIILIDEGLNEIDINLERKILKNIFKYYKDKTIIIVSHRLDNMDLYNKVVKVEDGKIKDVLIKR